MAFKKNLLTELKYIYKNNFEQNIINVDYNKKIIIKKVFLEIPGYIKI
jgi:hypothetical protein